MGLLNRLYGYEMILNNRFEWYSYGPILDSESQAEWENLTGVTCRSNPVSLTDKQRYRLQ